MAELRPYTPTWRDTVASWMMGQGQSSPERRAFVGGLLGSTGLGNTGVGVVDATPVGGLLSMQEAGTQGDKLGMAANAASMLPMGKLAMFLGPGAKIADKVALGKAAEMERSGATREAIMDATGWFKGVDGNWRFEIPDDKSFFKGNKDATTLGEALTHDELYKNYPSAEDLAFEWTQNSKAGYNGVFRPHPQYRHGGNIEIATPTNAGSVTLHEAQHYVDNLEGNAAGSDMMPVKKGTPEWDIYQEKKPIPLPVLNRETFSAINGDTSDKAYNNYIKMVSKENKSREAAAKKYASQEGYRRDASEVLARTTQKRMDMTADERKAWYPWLDYDVPENQQIVRFRGLLGQ